MIGCTAETLRRWVQDAEVDDGVRPGVTADTAARVKELEREVRELRKRCSDHASAGAA